MPLGLALSEKQIPQITENTEKPKQGMELLESVGPRPRQARYQAALRPDMKLSILTYHANSLYSSRFARCAKPNVFAPMMADGCPIGNPFVNPA